MKARLEQKQKELQEALEKLQSQFMQVQEQIAMHKGALYYNDSLLKELEAPAAVVLAPE